MATPALFIPLGLVLITFREILVQIACDSHDVPIRSHDAAHQGHTIARKLVKVIDTVRDTSE